MNTFNKTIENKIFEGFSILAIIMVSLLCFSCSEDDPFFTATKDDAPRILNTDIPEWRDGQPQTLQTVDFGDSLRFKVIATPRDYTTISWYIDDELVFEGDSIVYPISEGKHLCKIVATTTQGLSTSRTFYVIGNPEPGKEKILWEGSFDVTWGTPFDVLKTSLAENVQEGTVLRVYVEGDGQGTATSAWWNNILTGEGEDKRGDIAISGEQMLEFTLNSTSMTLLSTQDGFLVVGNGYKITKITIM